MKCNGLNCQKCVEESVKITKEIEKKIKAEQQRQDPEDPYSFNNLGKKLAEVILPHYPQPKRQKPTKIQTFADAYQIATEEELK